MMGMSGLIPWLVGYHAADRVPTESQLFNMKWILIAAQGGIMLIALLFILLYPLTRELGRTIGKDIALLGYYNTPWTTVLHPELSSINVFPEKIVETVCDMYFNSSEDKQRFVLPEVIVRESSSLAKS